MKKVYCDKCRYYFSDWEFPEDCLLFKKELINESHLSPNLTKKVPLDYKKPSERNKNNDCSHFKKKGWL